MLIATLFYWRKKKFSLFSRFYLRELRIRGRFFPLIPLALCMIPPLSRHDRSYVSRNERNCFHFPNRRVRVSVLRTLSGIHLYTRLTVTVDWSCHGRHAVLLVCVSPLRLVEPRITRKHHVPRCSRRARESGPVSMSQIVRRERCPLQVTWGVRRFARINSQVSLAYTL